VCQALVGVGSFVVSSHAYANEGLPSGADREDRSVIRLAHGRFGEGLVAAHLPAAEADENASRAIPPFYNRTARGNLAGMGRDVEATRRWHGSERHTGPI
jgi:hypothetical protein